MTRLVLPLLGTLVLVGVMPNEAWTIYLLLIVVVLGWSFSSER